MLSIPMEKDTVVYRTLEEAMGWAKTLCGASAEHHGPNVNLIRLADGSHLTVGWSMGMSSGVECLIGFDDDALWNERCPDRRVVSWKRMGRGRRTIWQMREKSWLEVVNDVGDRITNWAGADGFGNGWCHGASEQAAGRAWLKQVRSRHPSEAVRLCAAWYL
jgi:hypothetical protein